MILISDGKDYETSYCNYIKNKTIQNIRNFLFFPILIHLYWTLHLFNIHLLNVYLLSIYIFYTLLVRVGLCKET